MLVAETTIGTSASTSTREPGSALGVPVVAEVSKVQWARFAAVTEVVSPEPASIETAAD